MKYSLLTPGVESVLLCGHLRGGSKSSKITLNLNLDENVILTVGKNQNF